MFGMGVLELLIVIALALLLFGAPAVLAFWLGFRAGVQRQSAVPKTAPSQPPAAREQNAGDRLDKASEEESTGE